MQCLMHYEDVWGSGCIDPRFLDLGISQPNASAVLAPWKEPSGTQGEPVRTTWRRENS
jgi:hypothetical protein